MTINLSTLSILLIEDTAPMRKILVSVLEIIGFKRIYSASSGEQGFRMIKDYNPDIVVTDWMMEPIDGIDLIGMIRTAPGVPNRSVPVILITGYAATEKVMRARPRDDGISGKALHGQGTGLAHQSCDQQTPRLCGSTEICRP